MKDEKISRENIKHAKVLIDIIKNFSNVEFIEVPISTSKIKTYKSNKKRFIEITQRKKIISLQPLKNLMTKGRRQKIL